jgi:hypothetical protein
MITIDEQIAYAQQLVNDGKYPEYARGILASLERLKAIDDMRGELPEEPTHLETTRRMLRYAPLPTTASRISYRQDKELIAYIDTLRDLLKRIVMEELK